MYQTQTEQAAPKRQAQVDGQLVRLASNVDMASKELEELALRLVPVSRVQPPPPIGKEGPAAVENLCPMAQAIQESNERIEGLKARIAEMRELLEI